MKSMNLKLFALVGALLVSLFLSNCGDNNDPEPEVETGKIVFKFDHYIDGQPIEFDNMKYTNAAGNLYEVSEIQWFISDITLNSSDGNSLLLDATEFAHYVDTDIPNSWEWEKSDTVPAGDYSSITVTFGIKGEKNLPLTFVNPPESDMIWPYPMGGDNGGYHYMKLNGFWTDTLNQRQPFNFHMGVGKVTDDDGNVQFIQNWFEVQLDDSAFTLSKDETKEITVMMNVDEWFQNPENYNHDVYGGRIMNNQEAMHKGCENGKFGVFTVGSIE